MRRTNRTFRLIAGLAVAVLVLGACGGNDDGDTGGTTDDAKILKIGVIAPLTGDLSALGLGIRNGVDLAIQQANEGNKIEGYKLELAAEDDTAKPDVGAQVATKLSSDDEVVAVVGTLNSSVAESVQPVLDGEGIAMVSPANTAIGLTMGADQKNPQRPHPNYFRVATTDAVQGPFAADFASKDLKATEVAIVHDNKTYGKGLTEAFAERFKANGGEVVLTETVNPGDKDFGAVVSRIRRAKPDLIYYGGEYPEASLLSSQIDAAGIDAPLMGGDGIYDDTFFETGGDGTVGDFATSVGAPLTELESAADFIEAYDAAGFDDPPSAYGGYAYDAANVIIKGLEEALGGGEGDSAADIATIRTDLIEAIQGVEIDGVTGPVAFDELGDTTTKVLTVYKVTAPRACAEEASGEEEDEDATTTTAAAGEEEDEDATTTTAASDAEAGDKPCWKPEKTGEFSGSDDEAAEGESDSSTTTAKDKSAGGAAE
ncbi:MAG TPA: branched-chain amino acid ABC transporter substrate-binding protein [Acidimicrobiales bacterium]|nr:branched-chain amino acid ABC transporter substrate-binding protein [Acidimicrobiales bacterium]